ncbi:MAG: aminopeptidase N C-terminal domain-containing protein, partial [Pseudomonadota bacterium]
PAFTALVLDAPSIEEVSADLANSGQLVDPTAIFEAVSMMRKSLGSVLAGALAKTRDAMATPGPYSPDALSAGKRALANRCLSLLCAADAHGLELAEQQFADAGNMTQSMAALRELVYHGADAAEAALGSFHARWKEDSLVVDKWLMLQATAPTPQALTQVEALTGHPSFEWKNPNKFRSLVGGFAMGNPVGFHAADGSGYRFVTDWLLKLDAINPQTTARLAGVFETWRRFTEDRQRLIRTELQRIAEYEALSRNTREIVERIIDH